MRWLNQKELLTRFERNESTRRAGFLFCPGVSPSSSLVVSLPAAEAVLTTYPPGRRFAVIPHTGPVAPVGRVCFIQGGMIDEQREAEKRLKKQRRKNSKGESFSQAKQMMTENLEILRTVASDAAGYSVELVTKHVQDDSLDWMGAEEFLPDAIRMLWSSLSEQTRLVAYAWAVSTLSERQEVWD